MDTNTLNMLLREIQENGVGHTINWNVIIPSIIGFLGVVVGTVMTFKMAKLTEASKLAVIAAEAARLLAEKSSDVAKETSATVEKVHTAVNSERTAMMEKLKQYHEELIASAEKNAVLIEKVSELEFSKKVSDGVEKADKSREKVVVVLPPNVPVVEPKK